MNFDRVIAFAFDHRHQFETIASDHGRDPRAIGEFKELAWEAASIEAEDEDGFGVLIDDRLGRKALHKASASAAWIGRPIEASGKFPLELECDGDLSAFLENWPLNQVVKVLCPYRLDDDADIRQHHENRILQLSAACLHSGHEWLLEIITDRGNGSAFDQVAPIMERFYDLGAKPDWWKLEPGDSPQYWQIINNVVDEHDPHCHGIIILGLNGHPDTIAESFGHTLCAPRVKGFAVGRTIFFDTARAWFAGEIDDKTAIHQMRQQYRALIDAWDASRCLT